MTAAKRDQRGTVRRATLVAALAALVLGIGAPAAHGAIYSNPAPIASPNATGGAATPYPSTIAVSCELGVVTHVRATLVDILASSRAVDVLLTGPGGGSLLLSDACSGGASIPDFVGRTFTFDDNAPTPLPETCTGAPPSGTYKPTNYDTADSFPDVAPPYPVGLANFRGLSPNGVWSLYVFDDDGPESIAINGGWRLEVTTSGAVAPKRECLQKKKQARKRCRCKLKPTKAKRKRCLKRLRKGAARR